MASAMLDPVLELLGGGPTPGIDPKRLANLLQMTNADLAALTRLHRVTLSRNPGSPEVQARLGAIAKILARAARYGWRSEQGNCVVSSSACSRSWQQVPLGTGSTWRS
jgi:hypothetical protein